MTDDFCLSDKIHSYIWIVDNTKVKFYVEEDVKEFIKRLKEFNAEHGNEYIEDEINKLAGEKLI